MEVLHTYKSPNFTARRGGHATPSMIIIHYTDMKTGQEALERLCDPASEVSAHYVIEEDGRLFQLVDDDKRAWHAGASEWQGESDINSASIGIELVNPGHTWGYRAFPDVQIEVLIDLCRELMGKYDIPLNRILGHSDVAPGRKIDPGELFPWKQLRGALSSD
ncbi:MAG: N-acetylmuramoyl-L-alanine amidase [Alphaproteobacteria bacterium]|nr:N-acetylmuramoyl-L-alanine amidase [Alphaproteobacteria bacterium]